MSNYKFQNILIFFFLILLIIIYKTYSRPLGWYHLFFFIQNHILFPFYDMNFPYYDTFSLGRFSPLAGQEFNLPILLNLSLDNLRFFIFEFILLIYLSFKMYGKNSFFEFNVYYFLLFLFFIIFSPGFITSTRFLYSEDFYHF